MGSLNRAQLIGNLGRDAELRYTPGGRPVASFSIATSEAWNDKDGKKQERTEWHRIVLWGPQAESLEPYLKKGKQVYVEGTIQTRKWQDKSGVDRYTTEIKGLRVVLLGGGSGSGRRPEPDTVEDEITSDVTSEPVAAPLTDDDIPF